MNRLFLSLILLAAMFLPAHAGTQNASGTLVSTFLSRAKQDINDSSANFFTDTEAIRWINEAVEIIASQSRCLETSENATLLTGQMSYALTTNHYDIETVVYDSGSTTDPQRYGFLNKVDPKELYLLSKEKGRPLYWWEWKNRLNVWPIPGTGQNATKVEVYMVERPGAITSSTDTIPVPYYFDNVILLYAKAKFYEKSEKPATGNYYRALFDARMAFYREEVRKNLVPPPVQQ